VDRFADLLVATILLAGLYATMAYGLGLIYGVLRIVNLNHGGMIMAGAYAGWYLHSEFGIDPYLSLLPVGAVSFLVGIGLYRGLVHRLPRGAAGGVQSLLLLFGLWLILRNAAYLLFTGNDQTLRTSYATRAALIGGALISLNRAAVFGVALLTLILLHILLTKTILGKAIRAVAQNPGSCTVVGIPVERIYAILFIPAYLTAAVGFVLLVLVLVLRPGGLFGQRVLG
jgi:branched-chain amino acid transport system permease protein